MEPRFELITTNLTGIVRNETMEGRNYLVVPMIMMVEGVLNGSNGPLYYPAEELAKIPQVWNHKPVVVYHPSMDGKSLSACDPEIINAQKIGIIMNTVFDGKRLKAEAWLEEERINAVDSRVMDAISQNKMMEVSTGLWTENEETPGMFKGRAYDAIARNHRPDHLAILPDQIGACSIADGAGLLRTNSAHRSEIEKALQYLGVANELSHGDIRQSLRAALDPSKKMDLWIEDVYDSWFVYEKGSKYYKQDYSVKDEQTILSGMPVEVEKKIVYQDMQGKMISNSDKEKDMNKKQIIDNLIANTEWEESDRKFLDGLTEDQLKKMTPAQNTETETPEKDSPETPAAPAAPKTEAAPAAPAAPAANQNVTPEQFLAAAPAGIREVLNDAMSSLATKKAELIAKITSNKKNVFTKDQLTAMNPTELTAIAALAVNEAPAAPAGRPANYFGNAPVFEGNAQGTQNSGAGEALVAPTMNFDPEPAKKSE